MNHRVLDARAFVQRVANRRISCIAFVAWLIVSNVLVAVVTLFSIAENKADQSILMKRASSLLSSSSTAEQTEPRISPQEDATDDDEFSMARQASFEFFDDISNFEWREFYQRPVLEYQPYRFPEDPNQKSDQVPFWTFHNWDVYFSCPRLRKIGGRAVCDPDRIIRKNNEYSSKNDTSKGPCLVYGVGEETLAWLYAADKYFGEGSCEFHLFAAAGQENRKNGKIIRHGDLVIPGSNVLTTNQTEALLFIPTKSRLGHDDNQPIIDVMIVDCDGCEWKIFREILDLRPRQLLLRTHDLPRKDKIKNTTTKYGQLPALAPNVFFDYIQSQGYVLFAKQVLSGNDECLETDWSFLLLDSKSLKAAGI